MNYYCPICKNDEWIIKTDETGYSWAEPCKCQKIRVNLYRIEISGLGGLLKSYTLDKFEAETAYQSKMKRTAIQYLRNNSNKWFTILGKSGSGKSHICTAMCGEFIERNYDVKFISWIDESVKLKQNILNEGFYQKEMYELKNVEVLYIDDFFKSENNTPPSNADIKLANEILNYRYNKGRISEKPLKTIISSERTLEQLMSYDEAIAGRIIESSGEFLIVLGDDVENFRLKLLERRKREAEKEILPF